MPYSMALRQLIIVEDSSNERSLDLTLLEEDALYW